MSAVPFTPAVRLPTSTPTSTSRVDLSLARVPTPTVSSSRATDPTSGQQFRAALAQSTASALAGVERMLPFVPGGVSMTTAVRGGLSPSSLSQPSLSQAPHLRSLEAVSGLSISGLSSGNLASGALDSPANAASPSTPSAPSTGTEGLVQSSLQDSSTQALELIALQQQIGLEQRQFTTVSNVLKARHETVKNLIGNVR